ncbi:MAG: hypothetical protein KBB55_03735 [Candidatus Buchananbacteria bacterium]|nr:hypothetical protein [Candidatus Buchananbacteria bacterium]
MAVNVIKPTFTNGLDEVIEINGRHSENFMQPEAVEIRRQYRLEHPTEIAAFKCMDGRLHLAGMTQTPMGIINPWQNIGSRFNLEWLAFQQQVASWLQYCKANGRPCLAIITYHFSRGDICRGCKGFNYDTSQARAAALQLKAQFDQVFAKTKFDRAIVCGIETDDDALILHGENGQTIDLSTILGANEDDLRQLLTEFYPLMSPNMREDLLPLVKGNVAHIAEVRASNRPPVALEHCEWIIGIGRGFDWLHMANKALIMGPFDPNLETNIEIAGDLILSNLREGRINGKVVLMSAALYRDPSDFEPALATIKAEAFYRMAYRVIDEKVPDLLPHLERAAVTVDMTTRRLKVLQRG